MPPAPTPSTNVLLCGEQTGGHVSVTEIVVPPHTAGPPLHKHDFDEAFSMLEGELIFQVDDALVTKGPGDVSFAARNVAHALANHSDAPARYLLLRTPAGFERHWARIAAEAAGIEPPQWALRPIAEVTIVGPQIAPQKRGRSGRPTTAGQPRIGGLQTGAHRATIVAASPRAPRGGPRVDCPPPRRRGPRRIGALAGSDRATPYAGGAGRPRPCRNAAYGTTVPWPPARNFGLRP